MPLEGLFDDDGLLGTILNAMPLPVFVVDDDVRIIAFNRTASSPVATKPELVLRRRAGEILHCIHHAGEAPEGYGRAPYCSSCVVRGSVAASLRDHKLVRRKAGMELMEKGKGTKEIFLLAATAPLQYGKKDMVLLILQDVSEWIGLRRILPIFAHCKKIRNDDRYWQSVERYFQEHLDLDFSHGICPECVQKLYPDLLEEDNR